MAVFVFARPALLQRSHSDMDLLASARSFESRNCKTGSTKIKSKKIRRARKGKKVSGGAAAVVGGVAGEKAKKIKRAKKAKKVSGGATAVVGGGAEPVIVDRFEKAVTGQKPTDALRQQIRTASFEDKVAFHRKWGCSKCAWHKCTPSCWKARGMRVAGNATLPVGLGK